VDARNLAQLFKDNIEESSRIMESNTMVTPINGNSMEAKITILIPIENSTQLFEVRVARVGTYIGLLPECD
jgi:hypothetical protein